MRFFMFLAVLLPALVYAAPAVEDISATSIAVSVPKPDHKAPVSVTVQRLDELVDDKTGDLLAARIVDVEFAFDVDKANKGVVVNNVPVPLGLSSIEVETTVTANAEIADVLPPELIEMAFDIGLAAVNVSATEEFKMLVRKDLVSDPTAVVPADYEFPDLIEVRRITIQVKVTEINGVKVEQMELVEQVLDVLAEGWILRGIPRNLPSTNDPKEIAAMQARREAHRRHCMKHHRMGALWNKLPRATRVAVAAFFGSLLLLVFFVALPLAAYVHWKERRQGYQSVPMADRHLPPIPEEDEEAEYAAVDEKAWLRVAATQQQKS